MNGRRPAGAWIFRCSASRSDHFQCKHQEYLSLWKDGRLSQQGLFWNEHLHCGKGDARPGFFPHRASLSQIGHFGQLRARTAKSIILVPMLRMETRGRHYWDRFLRCRLRGQPIYAAGSVFPGTKKTITPHKLGQSPVNGNHYCGARGRSPVISSRSRANNTW